MTDKVLLNEFRGDEVADLLRSGVPVVAITGFGSLESHAAHLPLGCDEMFPSAVARQVAQRLPNTIVLPCTPFGTSIHYNCFPMAISLRFETNIALAEDIFHSLLGWGITRILVLNGHDGNIPALEIATKKVKAARPEVNFVFIPAWWELVGRLLGPSFFTSWNGSGLGHGGEGETSAMLAVRGDLVAMHHVLPQIPQQAFSRPGVQHVWEIADLSATGATGDPTAATPEKGQQIVKVLVDYLVQLIEELNLCHWEYDLHKAGASTGREGRADTQGNRG